MVSILPDTPQQLAQAQALAQRLELSLYADSSEATLVLVVGENACWLRRLTPPVLDWTVDFLSAEYQQNFAHRTRHNDPLSRAIGLHKKTDLRVLDMTAGLGKDALWLARCGATVTMIERHPVLAFLLEQAIEKLSEDPQGKNLAARMQLVTADAREILSTAMPDQFDVAYYDPMFEPRTKTALVKKDMQLLRALHGDENPDPSLIFLAKSIIPKVVVKRGKADPSLCEGVHHVLSTKLTRFDVY